jgi:predicted DNA-binding protein
MDAKEPKRTNRKANKGREAGEAGTMRLGEAAFIYDASPPKPDLTLLPGGRQGHPAPEKGGSKMKTSVYLEPGDVSRLSWLADVEGRPQAEIVRDAIRSYRPRTADRDFAIFRAVPSDLMSGREVTQEEIEALMEGFGEDALSGDDR